MKIKALEAQVSNLIARGEFLRAGLNALKLADADPGRAWKRELTKLAAFLRMLDAGEARPAWKILARDGNSKLPFLAYSSLPGAAFCPGAGACLSWCYSFRAHRYPAAYCRQAQNSALMQSASGRDMIRAAVAARAPIDGARVTFRLYVDGDFSCLADVEFWFSILAENPWLEAYGYSKSFEALLSYRGAWPVNYRLNMSGGHKYSGNGWGDIVDRTAALPITRGAFIALSIGRKVKNADHGTRAVNASLRAAAAAAGMPKVFTCPGKCGSCTAAAHACGSARFTGIPIVIATH